MTQYIRYPTTEVAVVGTVGANTNDGFGNPITSQPNGSQRALDVGIDVAGVQVDPRAIRALTSGTDSVAITAASLPLPTGAATSAKQPAIGTAGTSSVDVLSVQGVAGGTPVPISGSITATNPSVSTTGSAVPASATMVGGTDGTNLRAVKVSATGVLSVDNSAVTQPTNLTQISGVAPSATNPLASRLANGAAFVSTVTNGGTVVLGTAAFDQSGTGISSTGFNAKQGLDVNPISNVAQGAVLDSNNGPMIQGSVTTTSPTYSAGTVNPVSMTTAGAVRTDSSATTQPISGTVTANAGSGTFSVSGTVTSNAGTGTFTTDQLATTAAAWQTEGSIAAGSLTTSFATAFTVSGTLTWIGFRNNTNGIVVVSPDGGTTSAFSLDPGDTVSLDLKTMGRSIANATLIQAKYSGTAPTTGTFRVNGVH